MTGAAPARRLLARLVDEQAIETEPIAEVRADLAALGIDPARAIALSRRLAADANSPATTLLRRILESEEDDDEIRRLEQADIGAVRESLPQGATAATAARARRAAGVDSNVVGIRRRRSRRLLYGLSGVAAAMAASLVFYVGLSNNQPFRLQAPHEAPEAPAAPRSVSLSPELESRDVASAQLTDQSAVPPAPVEADAEKSESSVATRQQVSGGDIQAANQPAASGMQSAPTSESATATTPTPPATDEAPRADEQRSAAAEAADLQRLRSAELAEGREKAGAIRRLQAQPQSTPEQGQRAELVAGAAGSTAPSTTAALPPLPEREMTIIPERKPDQSTNPSVDLAARPTDSAATARAKEKTTETLQEYIDTATPTVPPAAPFGLAHPVVALLIVDPALTPPELNQKDYPTGKLPDRLGDARRLADGRAIAALVTLRVGHRVADAVIAEVTKTRALSVSNAAADAESTPLGPVAPGYELIELDRR